MQKRWSTTLLAALAALAAATPASAQVSVTLNQTAFRPGEIVQVTLGMENEGPAFSGDVYLGALLPDGTVAFLTSLSPPSGAIMTLDAKPGSFPKLFSDRLFPTGLDFTTVGAVSFPIADAPRGESSVFVALTEVGALADDQIDPEDLLLLVVQPFTVVDIGTGLKTAEIEVSSSSPTVDDAISVRLSGVWPDSCVPRDPQVRITGSEVRIDTAGPPGGILCLTVLTPWELPVNVGPLPAGTYRLVVINSSPGQFMELGRRSFEVR